MQRKYIKTQRFWYPSGKQCLSYRTHPGPIPEVRDPFPLVWAASPCARSSQPASCC